MLKIIGLPALQDNYIWIIHGSDENRVIVVDPGEAIPVLNYLKQYNLLLEGILLTHHHWDHTNGVGELLEHYPDIFVYSSEIDQVPGVTDFAIEGQDIDIPILSFPIQVINIPGHTLGHVAYVYNKALFCGDTLFSCGCGKIFEGTPAQMYDALQKLKNLSSDTLLYCGHEYTLTNIAFTQTIDPDNQALIVRKKAVEHLRKNNLPSLPVLLSVELETNVFLKAASVTDFAYLRDLKNKYH